MAKLLAFLVEQHLDLRRADLASYLWCASSQDIYTVLGRSPHAVRKRGVLYGPLRYYVPVPDLSHYRVILMLRDPRDVLVSQYFSMAYSHSPPPNPRRLMRFKKRRAHARTLPVDEFALELADKWRERYRVYASELLGQKNVTFLKYEDMINRTDVWLSKLTDSLGIELNDDDKAYVHEMGIFGKSKDEDIYAHVRKAAPGDHREKLSQDTRELLNDKLADVIESFDYAI